MPTTLTSGDHPEPDPDHSSPGDSDHHVPPRRPSGMAGATGGQHHRVRFRDVRQDCGGIGLVAWPSVPRPCRDVRESRRHRPVLTGARAARSGLPRHPGPTLTSGRHSEGDSNGFERPWKRQLAHGADPGQTGGAGSYSMARRTSRARSVLARRATTRSAMSIPAETPADVTRSPSSTKRSLRRTSMDGSSSASRSSRAQ